MANKDEGCDNHDIAETNTIVHHVFVGHTNNIIYGCTLGDVVYARIVAMAELLKYTHLA